MTKLYRHHASELKYQRAEKRAGIVKTSLKTFRRAAAKEARRNAKQIIKEALI